MREIIFVGVLTSSVMLQVQKMKKWIKAFITFVLFMHVLTISSLNTSSISYQVGEISLLKSPVGAREFRNRSHISTTRGQMRRGHTGTLKAIKLWTEKKEHKTDQKTRKLWASIFQVASIFCIDARKNKFDYIYEVGTNFSKI